MSGPQTAEGWVLKLGRERSELSSSELHVLITLAARHSRDFGAAHPKLDLMHKETHLSTRQIVRILNALADPDRPGGQVLHISFGPLPIESKRGHPIYGNVYRFVGFDPIPETARPRRHLGGRPPTADDAMSTGPNDAVSTEADDTGDGVEMTPATGSDDTGDEVELTLANSPLYPVENPDSLGSEEPKEQRNPDLNPARERARNGLFKELTEVGLEIAKLSAQEREAAARVLTAEPKPASRPEPPPARSLKCPDCDELVRPFGLDGTSKGHATDCWRFGLASSHPWFTKPRAEIEAELEQAGPEEPGGTE